MRNTLFDNRVLIAALLAWSIAQVSKVIAISLRERTFVAGSLVASGGMPSSHAALVTGLAAAIARSSGPGSPLFALAAVLAGIVMYDAAGVRLAVGRQAKILNYIQDELFHGLIPVRQRLYELVGHTPVQVCMGGLLGIVVGIVVAS